MEFKDGYFVFNETTGIRINRNIMEFKVRQRQPMDMRWYRINRNIMEFKE